MALPLKKPGVYIEEKNAFPGSVIEVATAIPAFIGYTAKAFRKGKSLVNIPTRITSLAEYLELFGGSFSPKFSLTLSAKFIKGDKIVSDQDSSEVYSLEIGEDIYLVTISDNQKLFFYRSIQLFYSNGGGTCYIISVGTYEDTKGIKADDLLFGLDKLLKEQEPTLVVIPEAVLLKQQSYDIYKQVLIHCDKMQNRFAIFDLHDGDVANDETEDNNINRFRKGIGSDNLSYGAVYYPWLNSGIVKKGDVTFKNLDDSVILSNIFQEPNAKEFLSKSVLPPKDKEEQQRLYKKDKNSNPVNENDLEVFIANLEHNFHLGLIASSPSYSELMDEIRSRINRMPAAPAMAGIYTAVDNIKGVWKAPANVSLNSVINPMVDITYDQQENLNVDAVSGISINAIRTFPGVGTLVWGGRTLDGNSLDWQYINVRRTIIMLEQSIKLALRSYVFEPNDANTWITVKSMIVSFLTEKWKQGALAEYSLEDAFDVQVGLGATMTALDILEGKMLVSVKLAIVRPAEFIVVTFQQQMQKS